MDVLKNARGYRENFLDCPVPVNLPGISPEFQLKIAPVRRKRNAILNYVHYSVVQNAERRLPFYSAANIDGNSFQKLKRSEIFPGGSDKWSKDPRIHPDHQFGEELYRAPKSDFDRGHMTKREDAQWGSRTDLAKKGAASTFFYTNATPQHGKVNRAIWRDIEDYILHNEAIEHSLRVSVMTGPVFRDDDPFFVSEVDGEKVKLPTLFWKVIYFARKEKLYCVCFLVGQEGVLVNESIVEPPERARGFGDEDEVFMDFEESDTYQVNLETVAKLSGLTFTPAFEPYRDTRPTKLILEEVNTRGFGVPDTGPVISNLVI